MPDNQSRVPLKGEWSATCRYLVYWIMHLYWRFMYWISSIERSGPRRLFVISQKRDVEKEIPNERSTNRIGPLSDETEDCLLVPKKGKCKPFVRRVSKHRYCTTKGPARRALIWRINGTSVYPRDHSYHRANPTTLATLRDHSFAFFRKHDPEGLRPSGKWNYQIIRESVTSMGFKGKYVDVLLPAWFVLNWRILEGNVRFLINAVENLRKLNKNNI